VGLRVVHAYEVELLGHEVVLPEAVSILSKMKTAPAPRRRGGGLKRTIGSG
jgi:hypothetical protein